MTSRSNSLLDHPSISGAYFFPRRDHAPSGRLFEVNGAQLDCVAEINDPNGLTLVYFHGNGETVADYVEESGSLFAELGANVVYVEYRGYGSSTGTPQLVAMLTDGQAVIESLGLDWKRVVPFGRSMGSLYAIELAYRHPEIAGLIIESGIADPAERFLKYTDPAAAGATEQQVRDEVSLHFNHQHKLNAYKHPLLILHTENDGLIDISHAERNLEWAGSDDKKLVRFRLGTHNSIMGYNRERYMTEVREFLKTL